MRFEFSTMGCPCALHVENVSDDVAQRSLAATLAEVDRLDRKYSHYRDDSLLAGLQRSSGAVDVDEETANLFDFATELNRQSDGLFDITAGQLMRLWDGRKTSQTEIARAVA